MNCSIVRTKLMNRVYELIGNNITSVQKTRDNKPIYSIQEICHVCIIFTNDNGQQLTINLYTNESNSVVDLKYQGNIEIYSDPYIRFSDMRMFVITDDV